MHLAGFQHKWLAGNNNGSHLIIQVEKNSYKGHVSRSVYCYITCNKEDANSAVVEGFGSGEH